ncbi:hypothetical protein MC885_003073 [Smutsia gigantea]|nr:hypothetical protein MC885_003073 [Smutsia gigantea]
MDLFISDVLSQKNIKQLAFDFVPYYSTLKSKVGGILSPKTIASIKATLQEGKLKDVANIIQNVLLEAENASLDVAVIGESGAGKSSFINALRGISQEEEGSAAVGVVETTMEKTPYQHPKYPNVTFWDLPGTGSPNFHPHKYLKMVRFSKYDFFIIISSSRFKNSDASLAQKIKDMGKKFYFVRTKVDIDLYNENKSKPKSFKKETVLKQIRDDCLANLIKIGVPEPRIFLVSSFDENDFDFPRLHEIMLKELPACKRYIFVNQLSNWSEAFIEIKRDFLKEKIWLEALKSSALAFIPLVAFFSGFDLPQQEKCLNHYRSCFGLDKKSIQEIAQKLGTSVQEIESYTKSLNFWLLVRDDSIAANAKNCAESCCSVTGCLQSCVFQFCKTYLLHMKFLNTVVDDAKILLHKISESKSKTM